MLSGSFLRSGSKPPQEFKRPTRAKLPISLTVHVKYYFTCTVSEVLAHGSWWQPDGDEFRFCTSVENADGV